MNLQISPLLSSSSGNTSLLSTESTTLLVDAGAAGSLIEKAIREVGFSPASLGGILITHEHLDHIKGAGVLSRKYDLPIYANAATWEQMQPKIGEVALHNIRIIDNNEFFLGDFCVLPIPLSHDAARPIGYSLMAGGRKITILTDTGKVTPKMLDAAEGSTIVLLEANHDVAMLQSGPYPARLKHRILSGRGHLSNDNAAEAAIALCCRGVRGILLGHLSSHNNTKQLAYDTVRAACERAGIQVDRDLALRTANRRSITGTYPCK